MDEKRKIIIPIGDDPDTPSSKSFFDTQAKHDARPVVPLSGISTMGPTAKASRGRKWIVLVVLLVAATTASGAAFLYINKSRSSGQNEASLTVRPVASKTLATLPWTHTPEDPAVDENTEAANDANETEARNQQTASDQKKTNKGKDRTKTSKKKNEDLPEDPLKRTQDELHKIRDIFEGPSPP